MKGLPASGIVAQKGLKRAGGTNRVELISPLPPSECAARLWEAVDSSRWPRFSLPALFGSRPVVGRVTESSLRLRKRIPYGNSFQTYLTGRMQPYKGGTVIVGEFGVHPSVRILTAIWFGAVCIFSLAGIGVLTAHVLAGQKLTAGNVGDLSVILAPIAGLAIVRLGRFLSRNEARFLTDFLVSTLDAREADHLV